MTNIIKDLTQRNNELLTRIEELERGQEYSRFGASNNNCFGKVSIIN